MSCWARYGEAKIREFELLLSKLPVGVVPFDADQAVLAHQAYRCFGTGTTHRARLNLGDCAAYALASALNQPLLFKGDDFRRHRHFPGDTDPAGMTGTGRDHVRS